MRAISRGLSRLASRLVGGRRSSVSVLKGINRVGKLLVGVCVWIDSRYKGGIKATKNRATDYVRGIWG